MRVINTYFLDQFPNMPVFEMSDRSIRLPFISPQTGGTFYMNEDAMTKGVSDEKTLKTLRAPFTAARQEIIAIRAKELRNQQRPRDKKLIIN